MVARKRDVSSSASVTLDPMRDCTERKNIIPIAADVVGRCSTPPGEILRIIVLIAIFIAIVSINVK